MTLGQRLRSLGSCAQTALDAEVARVNAELRAAGFDWRRFWEERRKARGAAK